MNERAEEKEEQEPKLKFDIHNTPHTYLLFRMNARVSIFYINFLPLRFSGFFSRGLTV